MRQSPAWRLVVAALLASAPASAQNLLPFSTFVNGEGFTGWNMGVSIGQWFVAADSSNCIGNKAAYGSSVDVADVPTLTLAGDSCVPINPATYPVLHLAALYRSTYLIYSSIRVEYFGDALCKSSLGLSSGIFGVEHSGWKGLHGAVTVPANAAAFRFLFEVQPQSPDQGPFEAAVDELYAGPAHPLHESGFELEGGSLCGWTGAAP